MSEEVPVVHISLKDSVKRNERLKVNEKNKVVRIKLRSKHIRKTLNKPKNVLSVDPIKHHPVTIKAHDHHITQNEARERQVLKSINQLMKDNTITNKDCIMKNKDNIEGHNAHNSIRSNGNRSYSKSNKEDELNFEIEVVNSKANKSFSRRKVRVK